MFKGLLFFLSHGWKYDKWYIIEKLLYQLTSCLVPVTAAILPKLVIDELMGARDVHRLAWIVALFSGYMLVAQALSAFLYNDSFTHRCRVAAAFERDKERMLLHADLVRLEDPEFLELGKRAEKFLTCDYHGFGYLLDCALDMLGQAITLLGIAAIIALLSGWLIFLFVALAVLGALAEGWAKQKSMALWPTISAGQRGWMYYDGLFTKPEYGKELRLFGIGEWLLQRTDTYRNQTNRDLARQNGYATRVAVLGAFSSFIQQVGAYMYLCARILADTLGIGDFAMYTGAVTAFGSALRRIMNSIVEIRAYDTYYDALDEYLNMPATLRQSKRLPLPPGPYHIVLRDVGFRYPGQAGWALRHINLTLEPGEKLSVVGENGAGKTTFIKLLMRLYDPVEGEILLNGVDIRDLDVEAYRTLFGTVFQDYKLFAFSLKDNVCFGDDVPDAQVIDLLSRVGLDEKLAELQGNLQVHVTRDFDESGFQPSGGEGQKIALARALYRNAPFILLDEPSAALDPRAEYRMYEHFGTLVEGKTAVFISHRLSSAQFCDRIAVFQGGRIVELGTHGELLTKKGLYAELFRMQSQFYR